MAHRTQESTPLTLIALLQRLQLRDSQMEEMYRARKGAHGAPMPFLDAPPSLHAFTNLETFQTLLFKEVMEVSLHRHD